MDKKIITLLHWHFLLNWPYDCVYGKCSKTLFFLCFLNRMLVIRAGSHKLHVRIANRTDPDQTAICLNFFCNRLVFEILEHLPYYKLNYIQFRPGLKVIKLFSYSTQLSMNFILLINVKMPTFVGILTFISMINTTSERLKPRNFLICRYIF